MDKIKFVTDEGETVEFYVEEQTRVNGTDYLLVTDVYKRQVYITSGIIDDKEQTVVDAVKAAGLEILEVTYQGEWVSVTARKQA